MDIANAPEPPWQRYQGKEPWWAGFRQGDSEAWYLSVFLPFWTALEASERAQYLERWPAPSAEWSERLTSYATKSPVDEPLAIAAAALLFVRTPNHDALPAARRAIKGGEL